MRMNIYVQDELAEQVKQHDNLNVSAICQEALSAEVHRRKTLAELTAGMERVELFLDDRGDVAFYGRELYFDGHETWVYLTRRGRLAIFYSGHLLEFDSFDELRDSEPTATPEFERLLSVVADELGGKHVMELDI